MNSPSGERSQTTQWERAGLVQVEGSWRRSKPIERSALPPTPTPSSSQGSGEPDPCCLPPTCPQPALAHLPLPDEGSQLLGPLVHQADMLDGVDQGLCIVWGWAEGKGLRNRTPRVIPSSPALVSWKDHTTHPQVGPPNSVLPRSWGHPAPHPDGHGPAAHPGGRQGCSQRPQCR